MKKKIGLLLATAMVFNSVCLSAFAWKNPLSEYNLYEDTHPSTSVANPDREQVMGDFYQNSMAGANSAAQSETSGSYGSEMGAMGYPNEYGSSDSKPPVIEKPMSRNETLRESSRNVYSDPGVAPGWLVGPVYYSNPTMESIIEKYHRSDFAGCVQESSAYVRQNPDSTLGYYYLAMSYAKVADKDNAIKAYEMVIALDDNPMIVKYATNGRNCVLGHDKEKCFQNVNVAELVYPYRDIVEHADLTPVDPNVLVQQNLKILKDKLSPVSIDDKADKDGGKDGDKKSPGMNLPFGQQDRELDSFINAPYGDGFSPELKKEYKQLQLRKLQDAVNVTEEGNIEDADKQKIKNLKDIKKFDNKNSDAGLAKLALGDTSSEFEKLSKDPEYIRQQQEYEELQMLFGSDKNNSARNNMMDMLPYMSDKDAKNLSPEVIQSMMMQSMMGNITL